MSRIVLLLWMAMGGALLVPIRERERKEPPDPELVREILLRPDVGSELVLEDVRVRIWGTGRRVFSFRTRSARTRYRSFVFLADPRASTYQTVLLAPEVAEVVSGPDAPELWESEVRRVLFRLGAVDWGRLPVTQQPVSSWRRYRGSLGAPGRRPRAGMVWAEARSVEIPGNSSSTPPAGTCREEQSALLETLDADFRPLAATSASRLQAEDPLSFSATGQGSCWASNSDQAGSRWWVEWCGKGARREEDCVSTQEPSPSSCRMAWEARYSAAAGYASHPAPEILQRVAFEGGPEQPVFGMFSLGDQAGADQLFWGRVTEINNDCP